MSSGLHVQWKCSATQVGSLNVSIICHMLYSLNVIFISRLYDIFVCHVSK